MSRDKILAVVDVGLMEYGGHHAGFAEFLANTRTAFEGDVLLYGSRFMDDTLKQRLTDSNLQVIPVFKTEPYRNFEKPVNFADQHSYISFLAREYKSVLEQLESIKNQGRQVLCFYPSLNWDHANALALAIKTDAFSGLQHLVCAMFNPVLQLDRAGSDFKQQLNFRFAFNMLNCLDQVTVFCSGYELARQYRDILEKEDPLPIHPCYLSDWPAVLPFKKDTATKKILLYMGDAKVEKGFTQLPEILESLLAEPLEDAAFIIQFTLGWDNPDILPSIHRLNAMAELHEQVSVIETFWTDTEMHQAIANTDIAVFNYDKEAYRDKTSGILWLMAWFDVAIIATHASWLTREAGRLGLSFDITSPEHLYQTIHQYLAKGSADKIRQDKIVHPHVSRYRNELYQPFWPWLIKQWEILPERNFK